MARATFKNVMFIIDDVGGTLRHIPINSLSVVGVTYDEQDLTAWQDAVKGALPTMPDAVIEWGGPFDDAGAVAVAAGLSGSHTVLSDINGGVTPLTLDVRFGMGGAAWVDTVDPQFGITSSADDGYLVTKYVVDPSSMTYSARAVLYPGSILPAWGVDDET